MVLTTSSPKKSAMVPKRGTTLPLSRDALAMISDGGFTDLTSMRPDNSHTTDANSHPRAARAHTLPSYSQVQAMNEVNKAKQFDVPITSRLAPATVSILSLPSSDNEALNFDNG